MDATVRRRLAHVQAVVCPESGGGVAGWPALRGAPLAANPCRATAAPQTPPSVASAASGTLPSIPRFCTAEQAVSCVRDNDLILTGGFVGSGCPEVLLEALRSRYDETHSPKGLGYMYIASASSPDGSRGMQRIFLPGLVNRCVFGWSGNTPGAVSMAREGLVKCWNLPLGAMAHMIRDVAGGRIGPIMSVGMGTFVDPKNGGGRILPAPGRTGIATPAGPAAPAAAPSPAAKPRNARHQRRLSFRDPFEEESFVERVEIGGRELLWYKVPRSIDVTLLRGTTADEDGNVSIERESLSAALLASAMAARNCGGLVIVQVERLAARGSIPMSAVAIPGAIVDHVVVSPPERHAQTFLPSHDPSLSGEVRIPAGSMPPAPLDARRVIAHRAYLEIGEGRALVNLGVGMPEGVAAVAAAVAARGAAGSSSSPASAMTLTTEAGLFGGLPAGGAGFGGSRNASARTTLPEMLDLYQGGGIDAAVLGMAEADSRGDVNVSAFGPRAPGCGGFIDISQNTQKVLFTGTFTSGGLQVKVEDGRIRIIHEGRTRKFLSAIQQVTFSAAAPGPELVLYITERAVFRRWREDGPGGTSAGLELIEIAPGVDLDRDVLAHMDFRPRISPALKLMDPSLFRHF